MKLTVPKKKDREFVDQVSDYNIGMNSSSP
jgi:hypothetical protein